MNTKWWIALPTLLILTACAKATEAPPAAQPEATAAGEQGLADQLFVFNWSEYMDPDLPGQYADEFGVNVVLDYYDSNEDLLAKLQAGGTGYDVIFPSDYMIAQMIDLGLLAELDMSNIPNVVNVAPENMHPAYDPENKYSVAYFWGTTGIGYDTSVVDPAPDSWAWIFEPEILQQYADQGVNVLDDQRELIGAALKYLGYSLNSANEAELMEAQDLMMTAREYWTSFDSTGYIDNLMIPGEIVLTHAWNGDVIAAQADNENWAYAIPKEGGLRWQDNMAIPASVTGIQKRTAEHFINWLLDPEIAGQNTNYVFYASANEAANPYIDPELLDDPSAYPPAEVLAKLEWAEPLSTETLNLYDRIWTEVKAGP